MAPPEHRQQAARAHLLGREEIFVTVRRGLKDRRTLPTLRSFLAHLPASHAISRSLGDHPRPPHLIVLVGGWDRLPILEAVKMCHSRFNTSPTVAVLTEGQGDVAELFAAGVCDFVRWPVEQTEFLARVRARLHSAAVPRTNIVLDSKRLTVRCNDVHATLTPRQFGILAHLVQTHEQWVTSRELLKVALGETRADTARVRFHVHDIRKKLRHEAWRLRSHRILGYLFETS